MKTMIITGASRGIGAATALLAASHGFAVAVNYHKNELMAEQVVAKIREQGGKAVAIRADIAKEQDVLRLFSETENLFGNLTVLVNNAGILEPQLPFEQLSVERMNRIFNINIMGHFLCAREAVKRMSVHHGGHGGTIVNVSSLAAKTGAPHEYIDYAASKSAIESMTIGLSKELAEQGIRVNAVRPAFIYTDIHSSGGEPNRIEWVKSQIPLQRGGLAIEVAEAILWLAGDKSSYTTGTFIDVSG